MKQNKTLLLIRLDAIGDYILFRNFLEVLKNSTYYAQHDITLVGNILWREICKTFDDKYIKNFIWIDRNKFRLDTMYKNEKLKKISCKTYDAMLSPVYSRENMVEEIVKKVKAKEKIGSIGDVSNITKADKNLTDKNYTKLIKAKNKIMFEFYRNREFFENLLQEDVRLEKPYLELDENDTCLKLPKRYATIFIGGSIRHKRWDIQKFSEIANYLRDKYNLQIVLCGGKGGEKDASNFYDYMGGRCINLVGKTTFLQLFCIIKKTNVLISNETSAPHIAVALNVNNIFVIFNGSLFGRFVPYPKKITKQYHTIFHPIIEKNIKKHKKLLQNIFQYGSSLDINDIRVNALKNKINKCIKINF